jgi:hypothetical protein
MSEYTPEEVENIRAGVAIMRRKLEAIKKIRKDLAVITRKGAKAKPATWRKFKRILLTLENELETPDHVVGAFAQVLTTAIQGKTRLGRRMAYKRCLDALDMAEAEAKGEEYQMPEPEEEVNEENGELRELRNTAQPPE